MSVRISSPQNNRIKNVLRLRQRRYRDRQQQTVVEGLREAHLALDSRLVPCEAYICRSVVDEDGFSELAEALSKLERESQTRLFEVTPEIFARIAYRGESGGVMLVVPYVPRSLEALQLSDQPFLAVIEDVEKPGNLGAILRSADAAGVDGVIICTSASQGIGTDIHNPNVIRASLGTLFTVPLAVAPTEEVIDWLRTRGIQTVAASPAAVDPYTRIDYREPVALIMGSEARGLSDRWLTAADKRVMIPMVGVVDSLNLAVSTALLLFEVVRQRTSMNIT